MRREYDEELAQDGGAEEQMLTNAERIKQAAVGLFSEYGYGSTTVRMIAKEAGLSQGQITAHYGSKEALFNAIVKDIIQTTEQAFDPLEERIEILVNSGKMDRDAAWSLIEEVVTMQIDFCMEPSNRANLMILNIVITDCKAVEQSCQRLQQTVRNKIEMMLAQLIQVYSTKKGYLRARTISRAVNGAIVSFGEHKAFLLDEVYIGSHSPHSVSWMKGHLKEYVLNSIRAADELPDY